MREVIGKELGGVGVTEVTVGTRYSFFQVLRVGTYLKHSFVVVGFQYQVVRLHDVGCRRFGDMAYVGEERKSLSVYADGVAYVVGAVVGHLEAGYLEIFYRNGLSFIDELGMSVVYLLGHAVAAAHALMYFGGGVDGDVVFRCQVSCRLYMVCVVVGDKHCSHGTEA